MEIGGTANSIISVGSFTSKNQFTNIFGNLITTNSPEIGEIAYSSGIGPTIDGRIKPDITAPGEYVVSSVNSFDSGTYNSNTSYLVDEIIGENYNWYFRAFSGTSMASPVVAGIIALMLEANPTMTPPEIKQQISENAWIDNYTGNVPNNIWGYGKIDAHETIKSIETLLSTEDIDQDNFMLYPNPTNNFVNFDNSILKFKNLEVINLIGQSILKLNLEDSNQNKLDISNFEKGLYLFKFSNKNDLRTFKIIKE